VVFLANPSPTAVSTGRAPCIQGARPTDKAILLTVAIRFTFAAPRFIGLVCDQNVTAGPGSLLAALTGKPKMSNFDATAPPNSLVALEAFVHKSSAAKQPDAVMLYADKSFQVERKFAILAGYCPNTRIKICQVKAYPFKS
jgi:hypothetical protein